MNIVLNDAERAFYSSRKMRTYTGLYVDPANMRPDDVRLDDIAHALSNICRFSGHCSEFYSVASHSVLIADEVASRLGPRAGLLGLLHDAHEAYGGDMIAPLKRRPEMTPFDAMQDRAQKVIEIVFDLTSCTDDERAVVKVIDGLIVLDEATIFMQGPDTAGVRRHLPHLPIEGASPALAEVDFLECFFRLQGQLATVSP